MRFTIKTLLVLTLLIAGCCWHFLPFSPKIRFHGDDGVLTSLGYSEPNSGKVRVEFTNAGRSSIYYPGVPTNDEFVSSFDLVHDDKPIYRRNPHWQVIDFYNRTVRKTKLAPGESAFVEFDFPDSFFGFSIQFQVTDWRGRKAVVKSKYIQNDLLLPN
jgi:hypothetical protein